MKKFNFNPNVLTAGVALALGFGIANGVSASTSSGSASLSGGFSITNEATASYSVDGIAQPTVTSNAVIVNVSEVGSFTLFGTQGTSSTDDKNESQAAVPGGTTTFTNKLKNTGNVTDTYTLNLTTNNDANITTGNQDYTYTNPTTISYAIFNADGTTATTLATSQAQTGTVSATAGTIKLLPDQYATLTYNVTSPTTATGGQSAVGTLTATSTYITNNATTGTSATLINENQAIIKLPVFAIQKTATNTNIDLNADSPTVDYTIRVKNDGSATYAADAVGVLIQDKLPTGLTVSGGLSAINVTSTDSSTINGTTPTLTTSTVDGRQIIAINGVALKVNETLTITFTAAIDKTKVNKAGVTNTAEVYDNYNDTAVTPGDNPTADIKDSSGTSNPTDAKVPNDPTGPGTGGDTSTAITFSDRSLTLTGSTSAELPPTSTSTGVTYTETITNTGNNPETGLTFTISNPSTTDNITPQNVTYTPQGGTAVRLTPDANGIYTIPGSLASGATGTIKYDVVTTGATIGTSETNTITLIPAEVTGTTKPTVTPVTNTTTVQGMTLVKEQALDEKCDKTPDTAFAQTSVTATPGQCIVYKITATNTMTTKQLTNVVIKDEASQWNTKATYVAGSIFDSANGATVVPGSSAQSSSLTLPANGGTGYLQFVVKINGAN
jgi:fimbrial isopeptide formation D2 family protein